MPVESTSTVPPAVLLAGSAFLAGGAMVLAFVGGPGPYPGQPHYPNMDPGPISLLILGMVAASAILYSLASKYLWRRNTEAVLATGVAAAFGGMALIAYMVVTVGIIHIPRGAPAFDPAYPQALYLVVWGIVTLLLVPLVSIFGDRADRRRSRLLPTRP